MMKNDRHSIVNKSLLSWIRSGSLKLQIILVLAVIIAVAARVFPLEMQKRIVNQAISFKALDLLLIYCSLYLAAVVVAGALKLLISYLQTVIGQQTVTAMRTQLFAHMLNLPLRFFRKTPPGMVVQSIGTELSTAGEFIGMAVAIPITSLLTLIAFGIYLFWLNPLLALVSFSIYPFVLIALPTLQRRANLENKKRVDTARELSGKITETVDGIHEIQGYGAHHLESQKFNAIAIRLLKIRTIWNLYRQAMKVSNNFFTSLGPLLIFVIGGLLTISGRLELGALVAFLSAQEKLYDPWRELIDVYQANQEASVSYSRTMESFDEEPEFELTPTNREPYQLEGSIVVRDLSYNAEDNIRLLDKVDLDVAPGDHVALIGFSGCGKSTLAHCIGQLNKYTGGSVLIGGKEVADLTKKDVADNLTLVSQKPFIFDGSIEENLLYGIQAQQWDKIDDSKAPPPSLDEIITVIQQTGMFPDVLNFGLNSVLDLGKYPHLVSPLIRLRRKMSRRLTATLADHIEVFQKDKYLYYSSIAKNLTFGSSNIESFKTKNLSANAYFLNFLNEAGLTDPLLQLGAELCDKSVAILEMITPDETLFAQSPIEPPELDGYRDIKSLLKKKAARLLPIIIQQKLIELALRFTPGRHTIIALPEEIGYHILRARYLFRKKITKENPGVYSFYRKAEYIPSHTILNNIFFGRLKTDLPQIRERINEMTIHLLVEEDLLEATVEIGMQFQVGTKGDRLSGGQRQKLAVGRAFLKQPKILLMDEATSALDTKSQKRIQSVLDTQFKANTTVIAVMHRLDFIHKYNKIAVMKSGKIEETGSYAELMDKKGLFFELFTGRNA